jgi:hypothetical protein
MLIAKFIRVNLALIVVVGFYGMVIDEPYWRDVGHGLWLYDYLFWFALILNGPSGFTAEYLSWLGSSNGDSRFVIQFALWCALLWPQWRLYHRLALGCQESRSKQMILYIPGRRRTPGEGAYNRRPTPGATDDRRARECIRCRPPQRAPVFQWLRPGWL